jgi:hypothetical protein
VSNSTVKALRFSLLLPLIHLAISVPVIYREEATYWRYIPRIQTQEDFEKTAPPPIIHSGPAIAWNPCYEYRASHADRFIFFAEFPAGILVPPHGASACNPTVLRPILQELKNWTRLKTRIVFLDCLLIVGIAGQWWLVGRWLDRRREHTRRWIIAVATITICGIVVAVAAFGNPQTLEFSAIILSLTAFVAWVVLLMMFSISALKWVLRLSRKVRPEYH